MAGSLALGPGSARYTPSVRARFLIVGGGVMGTAIAVHLAKRCDPLGEPVVVLEKGSLAGGSSGRSGAILRALYAERELVAMARDSMREFASFQARTGRSIGHHRCGVLTVAGRAASEWGERLGAHVAQMRELGVEAHVLDGAAARELVQGIEVDDDTLAVFEPQAGFVDAVRTVEAFAAVARSYGASTRLGATVEELVVEGGRVRGVVAGGERWSAETVILAAGPWTGALLARHGVELPLSVVRPEMHWLGMPGTEESHEHETAMAGVDLEDPLEKLEEELRSEHRASASIAHPVVLDVERAGFLRCEPAERRTRIGRIDHSADVPVADPDALLEELTPESLAHAREAAEGRLPIYKDEPDLGSMVSMYTMTPDGQPVLGPVPGIDGLFVVAGFSGHGFKLAPSVALGITQLVFGEPVSAFDTEFFAVDRFENGEAAVARPFGL